MNVVMRVEVRGLTVHELDKTLELLLEHAPAADRVARVGNVRVEPNAEGRVLERE
jgi:hypothetical protein